MPITRRKHTNPPEQPENNNHLADPKEQATGTSEAPITEQTASDSGDRENTANPITPEIGMYQTMPAPPSTVVNGERHDYPPSIEGGRRTARGELFRRPPQPPVAGTQPTAPVVPVQLQTPSHEINLPLGNLLHLAYNPGYTGSDEARSVLLQQLSKESKAGGRARCWSCGSLAIVYDRWNTRSKTFGEVGIASCEICGAWSVL